MPDSTGYDNETGHNLLTSSPVSDDVRQNDFDLSRDVFDIIGRRNQYICKRYCANNRYEYVCTVDKTWSRAPSGSQTCEWGNASYEWMMQDTLKPSRIDRLSQDENINWQAYFKTVIYSSFFLERWRDWRFGKRVKVPEYIKSIDDDAGLVYLWMRDKDEVPNISQRLNRNEDEILDVKSKIILELSKRGKLHKLVPVATIAFSDIDTFASTDTTEHEIRALEYHDTPLEEIEQREMLQRGWEQLTAEERFVLEAMKLDGRNAKDVIESLKLLNISLKKGQSPEETTEQQVYYFFRKAWVKLSEKSGLLNA